METNQVEAEYLTPEELPEDVTVDLAPLKITTPIELFKNLFDRMANIREKVVLWETKTVIKNTKTRDEAITLRQTVTKTSNAIEEAYLDLTKDAREYIKEAREYANKAKEALTGTKDNPKLGVAGRLTAKISEYAAECKRIEEEMKEKALAEQRKIEADLEAQKKKREAEEQAIRMEEERQIEEVRKKALEEAQAKAPVQGELEEGEIPSTDVEDAVINAMEEAQAQVDADRAYRDRKAKEKEIEEERIKDEANRKTNTVFAVAEAKGKVKGVQEIWGIELIDEDLLDKKYMIFDESKARAALKNGFYDKKEKDPEKIIPGLRCRVLLGKGGK